MERRLAVGAGVGRWRRGARRHAAAGGARVAGRGGSGWRGGDHAVALNEAETDKESGRAGRCSVVGGRTCVRGVDGTAHRRQEPLPWRKKAELVDVLVELAEADRGDLAVEMSEAFPLFLEECWKDFPGPCILTLVGRNKGAGS